MFAIFQFTGSKPEEKDLMDILHNEVDNCGAHSFRMRGETCQALGTYHVY